MAWTSSVPKSSISAEPGAASNFGAGSFIHCSMKLSRKLSGCPQKRYSPAMRRAAVIASLVCAAVFVVSAGYSQTQIPSRDFRISLSLSPFAEVRFAGGFAFTDGKITAKNPEELQRMFAAHGANEVYARIATTQKYRIGSGDHSMERGLDRARMAAALNLPFNPELGLFNIYGDVRCQPPPDFSDYPEIKTPGAWNSLTLAQMIQVLRTYGATAARQILDTGVKVRIWDI